jgi:kynureninase
VRPTVSCGSRKTARLRPVITGWFSAFEKLDQPRTNDPVAFDAGDQKFATATYDPISQYRAAAVTEFFVRQGLTRDVLQKQYRDQVGYLRQLFDAKGFDREVISHANTRPLEETGGFLALKSPYARTIRARLLEKGIYTDARDQIIRFGPAPYTTSQQCEAAMDALEEEVSFIVNG